MSEVRKMANGYMALLGGANKYEHIHLAEKAIGKPLPAGVHVHHVDGDPTNNSPPNLVICPNASYHKLLHARQRVIDAGGIPGKQKICQACQQLLAVEEFVKSRIRYDGLHGMCRECVSAYKKVKGFNIGKFGWKACLSQQYRRVKQGYTKRPISWL